MPAEHAPRRAPASRAVRAVQCAAVTACVELGLRTIPFPRLVRRLGLNLESSEATVQIPSAATWSDAQQAAAVVDAVMGAIRPRRLCLRRALVLGHLLRRHAPVLKLGVVRNGGEVAAHAWLELGGVKVPDYGWKPVPNDFVPLRCAGRSG